VNSNYEEKLSKNQAPDMLDKEIVRRELIDKGFTGEGDIPKISSQSIVKLAQVYLNVAETLTEKEITVSDVSASVKNSDLCL
jgi:phosphoribosylaminoimidazole-succinocarboxamide synthase